MQILSYIKDEKDSEKKEIEGKKKQRTEHHSDDKDKKGEILYLGCCKKGSNIFKCYFKFSLQKHWYDRKFFIHVSIQMKTL